MVSEFKKFEYGQNGTRTSQYEMMITLIGSVKNGIFERGFPLSDGETPVFLLETRLAMHFQYSKVWILSRQALTL